MGWQYVNGIVTANHHIDEDVWRIEIHCPEIAGMCRPGHFVMLRSWQGEPFLPRPMAIFHYTNESFDVVYKVKGFGTKMLAAAAPGREITVTGPLGSAVEHSYLGKTIALVGRGVGITPLLPVAKAASEEGGSVISLLSARTEKLLVGKEDFELLGEVHTQTDEQQHSRVTDKLERLLNMGRHLDAVYVSGSKRLLSHCEELGARFGFQVYVFLEERMACGIGYCKGCAIEMRQGSRKYSLCCIQGPLYRAESVVVI
ncbi:dihydroorotate dehydrogenase B (NAD(+)), electron transfer subunit [Collibacillus ludicampi]|uniref:Dihydroorotate dehydrogenase B (NAD(+)), electron transfer subunit n=1 Tax=Collibacillus ludicampi TaxID=2771369 RepID=A0AAV4LJR1_9BACL|nr:hypothetical protein [Collibacillus ludicampi]GIM48018.1 dihydroorotate dehydrogenase B (NAD(+)), electron transfer subunit [Collibacillus ludicampi]